MLTPRRSSRSLDAHLSSLIVARKSAMMVVDAGRGAGRESVMPGAIVRVTSTIIPTRTIVSTANGSHHVQESPCASR